MGKLSIRPIVDSSTVWLILAAASVTSCHEPPSGHVQTWSWAGDGGEGAARRGDASSRASETQKTSDSSTDSTALEADDGTIASGGGGQDASRELTSGVPATDGGVEGGSTVLTDSGNESVAGDDCRDGRDQDRDGLLDCEDDDLDDDGVPNHLDDAPTIAKRGTSGPGSVFNDPCVVRALDAYSALAANGEAPPLVLEQHHTLADQTGYYRVPAGRVVASSVGSVGGQVLAMELRLRRTGGDQYDVANVAYDDSGPVSYAAVKGQTHRGNAERYTQYATDGSFYFIHSGTFADGSRTIETEVTLVIRMSTSTESCPDESYSWTALSVDWIESLRLDEVNHFCVGAGDAHLPFEHWVDDGGAYCTCSAEFRVDCSN